jgi:hypothetical protein
VLSDPIFCGAVAGFTSQVAHGGGPPFQVYALTKRFDRNVFIGTSTVFFAVLNWMKLPAYLALGAINRQTLIVGLAMLPLAIASTAAGVVLVKRVSSNQFYLFIHIMLVAVGFKLGWDGIRGLWTG